eukprot:6187778-Pleurochrysis_carterae.AAC.1
MGGDGIGGSGDRPLGAHNRSHLTRLHRHVAHGPHARVYVRSFCSCGMYVASVAVHRELWYVRSFGSCGMYVVLVAVVCTWLRWLWCVHSFGSCGMYVASVAVLRKLWWRAGAETSEMVSVHAVGLASEGKGRLRLVSGERGRGVSERGRVAFGAGKRLHLEKTRVRSLGRHALAP